MTDGSNFSSIVEAAREHYENLRTDIKNSKDRVEHIRLTALAQEAHSLLVSLESFSTGLVYSHVANVQPAIKTFDGGSEEVPLDLPDFKSPFTPPVQ